jgi:ribosome maturation factor RimP
MGASRPFFSRFENMAQVHERERELHRDVAGEVAANLPEVEVLAVELAGPERLCVYVDHPDGVDHALCERVTNLLRGYLDRYSLEVSSPGHQRPLRSEAHFADAIGRRVNVRTSREIAGRTRFKGEVVEAGGRTFTLVAGSGEHIDVPYEAIARGNLIDEGR